MKTYYIYLMTNDFGNVIYLGITNNLERRVYEHNQGLVKGFTKKYKINKLVYFEQTHCVNAAISREKRDKEVA